MTEVLKMLPKAADRGQHSQAGGHCFSLYGSTLSPANNIFIFFFLPPARRKVCLRNFAIESAKAPSTIHSQKNKRVNERVNQILYEEGCIKEQIYFELFMLVRLVPQLRSPKLFSWCRISCAVWSCTTKTVFVDHCESLT